MDLVLWTPGHVLWLYEDVGPLSIPVTSMLDHLGGDHHDSSSHPSGIPWGSQHYAYRVLWKYEKGH